MCGDVLPSQRGSCEMSVATLLNLYVEPIQCEEGRGGVVLPMLTRGQSDRGFAAIEIHRLNKSRSL